MKKVKIIVFALLSAVLLSEVLTVSVAACGIYPPHSYQGAICRRNKRP